MPAKKELSDARSDVQGFSSALEDLQGSRKQLQEKISQAIKAKRDEIADLQEQRQELNTSRATKAEIISVAEKSIQTEAEKFDRRQREQGLGRLNAFAAAKLLRPPRTEHLQGAANMQLRESVSRNHAAQLFGVLFGANSDAGENYKINPETITGLLAWACGDMLLDRVKELADSLEDAPQGEVRESELAEIDGKIEQLQQEADALRGEARAAGLQVAA
ncbi:hypothetical protein [Thioalkalivibrio sp. ALJ1]|uniref:hypothetical protein n=1 Tax=Thioalkalivibrio sp. ALJ1 TaxID=1158144 RepID=UPI000571D8F7|nr:hypothetical protein [Thioalkalivibrio sp. ALJ1]